MEYRMLKLDMNFESGCVFHVEPDGGLVIDSYIGVSEEDAACAVAEIFPSWALDAIKFDA